MLYGAGLVALFFAGPNIASWIFGWVILAPAISATQTVWVTGVCGYFYASRGLAIAIAVSGSGVAAAAPRTSQRCLRSTMVGAAHT